MSIALNEVFDIYGAGTVLAIGGAVIGVLFRFFAQRFKFSLRAAVIDF